MSERASEVCGTASCEGHRPSTGTARVTADEARGTRGLAQRAPHVNGEGFPGN